MPASPFGLAYGIGAGISGAQQQMQNRQMAAQQMAMAGLQQQLLQHQVSQQQAEDQAFSQPIAPQMDTVPVMGTQDAPNAYSAPGVPFGTGTIPQPVQTGTQQVEHKYVTPYEKLAYDTSQRADTLAKMGFGRSAAALQQQSAQYGQMHQQIALQQAGRSILGGAYDSAIPYLKSIGMDVSGIHDDPSNSDNIIIQHSDGSQTVSPKQAIQMIAADPTKLAEAIPMMIYRKQVGGAAETRADAYRAGQESLAKHRLEMERIADLQQRARAAGGPQSSTAFQKNVAFYSRLTGISPEEAASLFMPGRGRDSMSPSQQAHAYSIANRGIERTYGGNAPDPNSTDPNERNDYALYVQNQKAIQDLASGKANKANPVRVPQTPKDSGIPTISSPSDPAFAKLKSGDHFKGPDGVERTKL